MPCLPSIDIVRKPYSTHKHDHTSHTVHIMQSRAIKERGTSGTITLARTSLVLKPQKEQRIQKVQRIHKKALKID